MSALNEQYEADVKRATVEAVNDTLDAIIEELRAEYNLLSSVYEPAFNRRRGIVTAINVVRKHRKADKY